MQRLLPSPIVCLAVATLTIGSSLTAQTARISEEIRVIETYPFSEPNPTPILTRDTRLYPYHSFEGYATGSEPREWKVVLLENEYIEVFVLPEVGGKVWGAVVKASGHEFIYRNEVMKFRNIALRGPWTSGGIEFNFGVIGHTPSTATPVDYVMRENPDGSVSCIVGAMDLPSRTHWRVEIRLPADRAYFETNVLWYNPTPLTQPYYNWMTAAAFARNDLEMSIPGNAFLEHSGAKRSWPTDPTGRYLPAYANNTFGGHKSYHVVGELQDFFGGYYHDDDYGFGHWASYEQMPGQKLWLWALSREGGIWEDLLTDTDGQYVEYQAGRLFVQYAPASDVNPITQVEFDPGATDRWSETWFPLEGLGGLTDASRDGAMYVTHSGNTLTIRAHAFGNQRDTLHVMYDDREIASEPMAFTALQVLEHTMDLPGNGTFRVTLPALGLTFESDPATIALARPFDTDSSAVRLMPEIDRNLFAARELARARYYGPARELFAAVLAAEPWNREGLLSLADLEYRRGRYHDGLTYINAALQLDTYDARTNFIAGNLYHALGDRTNALESYGWSSRATGFRSISYIRLAELKLAQGDLGEAARYASLAIDYDQHSIGARQILAMVARRSQDPALSTRMSAELLAIDPLQHFVAAEAYLASPGDNTAARLTETLRGEFSDQVIMELALDYLRRGSAEDAKSMFLLGERMRPNAIARAWLAWLDHDPSKLRTRTDLAFVFPYRVETIPVLEWAVTQDDHWSWRYLLALNLWARDRAAEAAPHLLAIGNAADFAPMYVARAALLDSLQRRDPEIDLRRAATLAPNDRIMQIHLVRFLQDRDRWEDALAVSGPARVRFPNDFNLDLLHVASLNNLGRATDAIDILGSTHVLPSENARESHHLYEQAHTIAALDAMDRAEWVTARSHLISALDWPERLGQGRPYQPEERLVQYLLATTEQALGHLEEARIGYEAVVTASQRASQSTRWDALTVPSLIALNRPHGRVAMPRDADETLVTLIGAFTVASDGGGTLAAAARRVAAENPRYFADLDGRLLLRALTVSP